MKINLQNLFVAMLLFLSAAITAVGQKRTETRYDDWPTTVPSNAERSNAITPNFVTIGTTWDHRVITYFFQSGTGDIVADDEQLAVRDAFALWSSQTDLAFLEVCNEAEADIVMLWGTFNHGDTGPFDGAGGNLAHTLGGPPPNVFGAQAGDIHFDDSETWTLNTRANNSQPIDLVTVAAHEIGHALGLHHTTVSGSLMLPNYTGSRRSLGQDDIAGIRSLYGNPANNIFAGPATVCTNAAYVINNPPANTTVTYSSNRPTTLTIDATTGVATRVSNNLKGQVTITATITGGCNTTTLSRSIWVGPPGLSAIYSTGALIRFTIPGDAVFYNSICKLVNTQVNMTTSGGSGSWQRIAANPTNTSWSQSQNNLKFYLFAANQTATFRYTANNTCGTTIQDYSFKAITCGTNPCATFVVSPNPSSSTINIAIPNIPAPCQVAKQADAAAQTDTSSSIRSAKLYTLDGQLKRSIELSEISKNIDMIISDLPNDIYILKVSDGSTTETHRIVKE